MQLRGNFLYYYSVCIFLSHFLAAYTHFLRALLLLLLLLTEMCDITVSVQRSISNCCNTVSDSSYINISLSEHVTPFLLALLLPDLSLMLSSSTSLSSHLKSISDAQISHYRRQIWQACTILYRPQLHIARAAVLIAV